MNECGGDASSSFYFDSNREGLEDGGFDHFGYFIDPDSFCSPASASTTNDYFSLYNQPQQQQIGNDHEQQMLMNSRSGHQITTPPPIDHPNSANNNNICLNNGEETAPSSFLAGYGPEYDGLDEIISCSTTDKRPARAATGSEECVLPRTMDSKINGGSSKKRRGRRPKCTADKSLRIGGALADTFGDGSCGDRGDVVAEASNSDCAGGELGDSRYSASSTLSGIGGQEDMKMVGDFTQPPSDDDRCSAVSEDGEVGEGEGNDEDLMASDHRRQEAIDDISSSPEGVDLAHHVTTKKRGCFPKNATNKLKHWLFLNVMVRLPCLLPIAFLPL